MVDAVRSGFSLFARQPNLGHMGESYAGTPGDDEQTGTRKNDTFDYSQGGDDTLNGGAGNDVFFFGDAFTAADHIFGGRGDDRLTLSGDYLNLSPVLTSIETLKLLGGHHYSIQLGDGNIAAGKTLTVDAFSVGPSDNLHLGIAETDGRLIAIGSGGDDEISGGDLNDDLRGLGGADVMHGGLGADRLDVGDHDTVDTLVFYAPAESTGRRYDEFYRFDFDQDLIGLSSVAITDVDTQVTHGSLSDNGFDRDLKGAIGNAELHRHHAVLFIPDSGTLAGLTFLIADANGRSGYQPGQDYVFLLTEAHHINHLDAADFYVEA